MTETRILVAGNIISTRTDERGVTRPAILLDESGEDGGSFDIVLPDGTHLCQINLFNTTRSPGDITRGIVDVILMNDDLEARMISFRKPSSANLPAEVHAKDNRVDVTLPGARVFSIDIEENAK